MARPREKTSRRAVLAELQLGQIHRDVARVLTLADVKKAGKKLHSIWSMAATRAREDKAHMQFTMHYTPTINDDRTVTITLFIKRTV